VSPEEVVRAELAAWGSRDADKIMCHFSTDAVWDNVPIGVARGHDEIRKTVDGYLQHMTHVDIQILNLAIAGNVVLTERVDHFVFDGKVMDARCMGAFEVSGDRITAWRDYFDAHR
jgi:limonene-1,2-epoxide hydrolase